MAFNTLQLIGGAYKAANINPGGYKVLTPEQKKNGLFLLNVLLSDKTVDTSMLLYWQKLEGVFDINVGEYFIENLIQIETLTFFMSDGTVRFPTQAQSLDEFMGSGRAMNTDSLPFFYYVNKVNGGATLYVYFLPSEEYAYQIWGQFQLTSVTLFENLEDKFPMYYINFLRLQLAKYLCIDGGFTCPPLVLEQLVQYRESIAENGTVDDYTMTIYNPLAGNNYLSWPQLNIGKADIPGT